MLTTAAVTGLLLLASPDGGAKTAAVLGVDGCAAPLARYTVELFRTSLAVRLGPGLLSEADSAAPFGGLSGRNLADLRKGLERARSAFYAGNTPRAVQELGKIEEEASRLRPSDQRWQLVREVLATQAQVQLGRDPPAADRVLRRLLSVDPQFEPDTGQFPPSFIKAVQGARAAVKAQGTNRLDIRVDPPGTPAYVGGRPVGKAPLSLQMVPGDYLVEADFGHRAPGRMVTVPKPGDLPNAVSLSAAVEGAVDPSSGPCVSTTLGGKDAITRAAQRLNVDRLILLRVEQTPNGGFLVGSEFDPRTRTESNPLRAGIPSPKLQDIAAKELASRFIP